MWGIAFVYRLGEGFTAGIAAGSAVDTRKGFDYLFESWILFHFKLLGREGEKGSEDEAEGSKEYQAVDEYHIPSRSFKV